MTSKLKVSEIFGPAGYWNFNVQKDGSFEYEFVERWGVTQGEGKHIGTRSVFIRSFACNLTCPSFGLDHGEKTSEPDDFAKAISVYKNISETPAAQYGCDSYFSWHPGFKSLSPMLNSEEVVRMAIESAGGSFDSNPYDPIHLIFTGGEPMMPGWQKSMSEIMANISSRLAKTVALPVTIETNGTQPVGKAFKVPTGVKLTWSVSPKLSASGHSKDETLFPEVIAEYLKESSDLYLKFVVQSEKDFDEVDDFVRAYEKETGIRFKVYIMPEGGTPAEYRKHSTLDLVSMAVRRGYNITPRLQVLVGENLTGW